MHLCCNSVAKLKVNLAQVCGSFFLGQSHQNTVCFQSLKLGVAEGTAGDGRALGDAEEQQAKPWEK